MALSDKIAVSASFVVVVVVVQLWPTRHAIQFVSLVGIAGGGSLEVGHRGCMSPLSCPQFALVRFVLLMNCLAPRPSHTERGSGY